jgi:hypothetical protein
MDRYTLFVSVLALCFVVVPYLAFRLLKLFNSADGERYRKRRMQGPFVPLSAEEIAEDEARIAAAGSKRTS